MDLSKLAFFYLIFAIFFYPLKYLYAYPFIKMGVYNMNLNLSIPELALNQTNLSAPEAQLCLYYAKYLNNTPYYEYVSQQCNQVENLVSATQNQNILSLFGGWIMIAVNVASMMLKSFIMFPILVYSDLQPIVAGNALLAYFTVLFIIAWEIFHLYAIGLVAYKVIRR